MGYFNKDKYKTNKELQNENNELILNYDKLNEMYENLRLCNQLNKTGKIGGILYVCVGLCVIVCDYVRKKNILFVFLYHARFCCFFLRVFLFERAMCVCVCVSNFLGVVYEFV